MNIFVKNVQEHLENFEIFLDNSEVFRLTSKYSNVEDLLTPYEMAEIIMFSTPKSLGGLELKID